MKARPASGFGRAAVRAAHHRFARAVWWTSLPPAGAAGTPLPSGPRARVPSAPARRRAGQRVVQGCDGRVLRRVPREGVRTCLLTVVLNSLRRLLQLAHLPCMAELTSTAVGAQRRRQRHALRTQLCLLLLYGVFLLALLQLSLQARCIQSGLLITLLVDLNARLALACRDDATERRREAHGA